MELNVPDTIKINLIPIEQDVVLDINRIRAQIIKITGINTQLLGIEIQLEDFFNNSRKQYDAGKILNFLDNSACQGKNVIITSVDIFIPIFTYIFGLAKLNGNSAIISTVRLNGCFYGLPEDSFLLEDRVIKEILHEIGHLFGLRHCDNYECVMASSTTADEIDIKENKFCLNCRGKSDF